MFRFLENAGVIGDPVDLEAELVIDWPREPPLSEAPDAELIRAVREAGGRVFVGFKEAGLPRLAEIVTGPAGERRARVRPVSAATLGAGREVVRGLGGIVTRPYRSLPFVAATIDPEVAPELRRHPLVDYVAPEGRGTIAEAADRSRVRTAPQTTPYNIDRVKAPFAWGTNQGEGARVWILDTGTYGGLNHHPDLPALTPHACLTTVPNATDREDNVFPPFPHRPGHGTRVAGVAVALDNTIDVIGVAPAVGFWIDMDTAQSWGASFAAPAVTGTAALIWTRYPGWSNGQVRSKLHTSVTDLGPHGRDDMFGRGLLDASKAVVPGALTVTISDPASGYAAADLPYGGEAFSMAVVVPLEGVDPHTFVQELDAEAWEALTGGLRTGEGSVLLPRFTMEYGRKLNDDLIALGMIDAFDRDRADFSRIRPLSSASAGRVFGDEVKQKTFVRVDEEGTEAAAATAMRGNVPIDAPLDVG